MIEMIGGDDGIRTHDTLVGYAHLANECLQPLGHVSVTRDMPQLGPIWQAAASPAIILNDGGQQRPVHAAGRARSR